MTRRWRWAAWGVSACLLAGTGCGRDLASQWAGPFFFIQMADTQLGMATSNADMATELPLFEEAIRHANRLRPAFVVICGDLINLPMDEEQTAAFHRIAGGLDPSIPLFLVSGNHDVGNEPTPESLRWYRDRFGADVYAFDFGGCRFLVLNSTVMHRPGHVADALTRQEAWLADELRTSAEREPTHLIVFQHHPLFIETPDEPDAYANIPQVRRQRYMDLFAEAGVTAVLAGHHHRCGGGNFGPVEMIITGSVTNAFDKVGPGLRIVRVYRDRLEHAFYPLAAMPASVELTPALN